MSEFGEFERQLFRLFTYLNKNPTWFIREPFNSNLLEIRGIIKKSIGTSIVNAKKLLSALAELINVKDAKIDSCTEYIYYIEEKYNNSIRLIICLAFFNGSELVNCLKDIHPNEFVIPIIFMPLKLIDELYEKRSKLINKLAEDILNDNRILLLFPIILPFPQDIKLLRDYRLSIDKLREVIRNINENIFYGDTYGFLAKSRKTLTCKALIIFSFLYELLSKYGFTDLREQRGWKSASKWFEEIIKLLLINEYVRGSFSEDITNFLINEYKTGGPGQEDVAIPIRKENNKVDIIIIDAKLWKGDICKSIVSDTHILNDRSVESLNKYESYVSKKSRKLRKLEELLIEKGLIIDSYFLVFIQRVKSSSKCIERLNSLESRSYRRVIIYSLEEFIERMLEERSLI